MKRVVYPLFAAVAILVTAGCGGTTNYSPEATRECLDFAGAVVSEQDADYIAAGSDGYAVRYDGKTVNIAFGEDGQAADHLEVLYEGFGGNEALYRKGNAILSWDDQPGSAREVVDGCLKS